MSNMIVEGFGTYGVGACHDTGNPVTSALLAGAWAQPPQTSGSNLNFIETLPWDPADTDLYMSGAFSIEGNFLGTNGWRRVFPSAEDEFCVSFYYACDELPVAAANIISFYDSSLRKICQLALQTTGGLQVGDGAGVGTGNGLSFSSGPVVVAQSAVHMEIHVKVSTGVFQLYVNGAEIINATGLAFSQTDAAAQLSLMDSDILGSLPGNGFISHLIVRDSASGFPVGDRRVATLLVNADDLANQGWTGEPLHRFGVGILNNTAANSGVSGPVSTVSDLGAGDWTIEMSVRFQAPPSGANKAVLFGKWDESTNLRSYQLYLGGPSLETGLLVFRTSLDGTTATVVEKLKWPWVPAVGHWYEIALVRASGELLLFIDGVQQGLPIADTDTYFAGGARPALGVQPTNSGFPGPGAAAGTALQGWFDEHRITVGTARYTANYTPPVAAFPRGAGSDPDWAQVAWLSGWDNGGLFDDGPNALTLTAIGTPAAITPDDGQFNFQVLNKTAPDDDTFIEAALLPATGELTYTGNPAANDTVTVATKDGTNAAVYTYVAALTAAYQVLIGANAPASAANLVAAINAGPGSGTVYGTGTLANADVTAVLLPSNQVEVTASTPGTVGNALASTKSSAVMSWAHTTLTGGQNIPGYSQFSLSRLPSGTTVVDSITLIGRQWKSDAGPANTQMSLIGVGGGVENGPNIALANTPTLSFSLFATDPDTSGQLTPTTILTCKARINRLD